MPGILHSPRAVLLALPLTLLGGCADYQPRTKPRELFDRGDQWTHAPAWATGALRQDWWTSYGDKRLSTHVQAALGNNADLRVLAARLAQARAQTLRARAAGWPSLTLGNSLRFGNEQTRMTGFEPTDLEPWASSAEAAWELDLFGRLRAATRAAEEARQAAFWDLHGGRLLVAASTSDAFFRILRLNEERSIVDESVAANRRIVQTMRERERVGLIATTELRRQEAEQLRLERTLLDLDRLRGLAVLQLDTLRGGGGMTPASLAGPLSPLALPPLPGRTTTEVLAARPDLLAAEARVRAAFQLEESSRLDLLPSLRLGEGARGESSALVSGFRTWMASVGPSLDIPIYDPKRLASVRVRRAETDEAAAHYRSTALLAFEEVEGAYWNFANRRQQLAAAQQEVAALEEARLATRSNLEAGLVSQVELLESERRTLEARRQELAIRHALLRDHLALVQALGGA